MRAHVQKKLHRQHVRNQTLAGLANTASGAWVPADSLDGRALSNSTKRNVLAGTLGKNSRRRHRG